MFDRGARSDQIQQGFLRLDRTACYTEQPAVSDHVPCEAQVGMEGHVIPLVFIRNDYE